MGRPPMQLPPATVVPTWPGALPAPIGPPVRVPPTTVATPVSIGYPRPGTPYRPGGASCVPRTGRRARSCDRCPRSASGVQSPRASPLRSWRPRAGEARPTRHHGRATDHHRRHLHALARRAVLVLAATGRPRAGAGPRSLRPRPAPRWPDHASASRHHHPAGRRPHRRARPPRRPSSPRGSIRYAAHRARPARSPSSGSPRSSPRAGSPCRPSTY